MVTRSITEAVFVAVNGKLLTVQRWWSGLSLSKKKKALLQVVGIFLAVNAFALVAGFVGRWLGIKPGVDTRVFPTFRGSLFVDQGVLVLAMFILYREILKQNS